MLYGTVFVFLENANFEKTVKFVETSENVLSIFDVKNYKCTWDICEMEDKEAQVDCMVDEIKQSLLLWFRLKGL